jgi:uncharacterized phiE125 gp8 family phage protein
MLIRLSTPDGLAVPLEDVKADLRVDFADDDDMLTRDIRSETRRYEDYTGRMMLPADLEYRSERWDDPICIPASPVREVVSVLYLDATHAEQTVDAADWYIRQTDDGAEVWFNDSFGSPTLSTRQFPVRVRFSAGYDDPSTSGSGDDPELAPNANDQRNITAMVRAIYDGGEPVKEKALREIASNRRIFR